MAADLGRDEACTIDAGASRFVAVVAVVVAVALAVGPPTEAQATKASRPRLTVTLTSSAGVVTAKGAVTGIVLSSRTRGARWQAVLEQRQPGVGGLTRRKVGGRWRARAGATLTLRAPRIGRGRGATRSSRLTLRWRAPRSATAGTFRVRIIVAGRTLAISRSRTLQLHSVSRSPSRPTAPEVRAPLPDVAAPTAPNAPAPPNPRSDPPLIRDDGATYSIPDSTRVYAVDDVAATSPGVAADQAVVVLAAAAQPPVVGGHVAIAPTAGLPEGMFARVLDARPTSVGAHEVVVQQAAVSEVLDDLQIDFTAAELSPTVVDADGVPVVDGGVRRTTTGGIALRGSAIAAGHGAVFDCEMDGLPRDAEDLWETGFPFPVEVALEHLDVDHRFHPGYPGIGPAPYLLLQLSGEAVASIGFEAKSGFSCELSSEWRKNHRLRFTLATIAGVPANLYLEPHLSFDVDAAGTINLSQRHYFTYTLEKTGDLPLDFRAATSRDPVAFEADAALSASLFAGGDISLMLGGAYKDAAIQAGLYGAFGPEFALSTDSVSPGCVAASVRLKADFGIRLELWTARWNVTPASLTTSRATLAGSPWCIDGPGPDPEPEPEEEASWPALADTPVPFSLTFEEEHRGSGPRFWPSLNGGWLQGQKYDGGRTAWRFRWISSTGEAGRWWEGGFEPRDVAAAGDGAMLISAWHENADFQVLRIGPEGPQTTTARYPWTDYAYAASQIAVAPSGRLFWDVDRAVGIEPGVWELDPVTLQLKWRRGYGLAGVAQFVATSRGLVDVRYTDLYVTPYALFTAQHDGEDVPQTVKSDFGDPSTSGAISSIGYDGGVAKVRTYVYGVCSNAPIAYRAPSGEIFHSSIRELLEAFDETRPIANDCHPAEVTVTPQGAIFTVTASTGTYQAAIDSHGEPASVLRIGERGINVVSRTDQTGLTVTGFTRRFSCPDPDSGTVRDDCSDVRIVTSRENAIEQAFTLDDTRGLALAGMSLGRDQVLLDLIPAVSNDATTRTSLPSANYKHLVKTLTIPLRTRWVD